MTNKFVESILAELEKSAKSQVISEERKEFLLTDRLVAEKIIAGLTEDLKRL
jgi:hypothetical protein